MNHGKGGGKKIEKQKFEWRSDEQFDGGGRGGV